jgi:hypothetical protein
MNPQQPARGNDTLPLIPIDSPKPRRLEYLTRLRLSCFEFDRPAKKIHSGD